MYMEEKSGKFEKMTRNMALKEAWKCLYKQSQETDLEKTIAKYRFNESKIEESKRRLSRIDVTRLNKKKLGKCMSWKTKINVRHKNKSSKERSKLNLQNHAKKRLQEIIDKLHISNFILHETPSPNKPSARKGCHKRKDGNLIFLSRNIRKVKTLLHLPLGKEKENTCTPRKNEKYLCSGSPISVKFSGSQNCKMVVNTMKKSNVKSFDSGFYEIIDNTDSENDDEFCLTKLSQQTRKRSCIETCDLQQAAQKRCHPKKPIHSVVKSTANNERSAMKRNLINSNRGTQNYSSPDKSCDSMAEENPRKSNKIAIIQKSKEIVFKPLFAKHCGGTWKQIVDEN